MNKFTQAVAMSILVLSLNVHAQQGDVERAANELNFSLDTSYGVTDNYLLTPTNEQTNQFWQISPAMHFQMQTRQQQLVFTANARHVSFKDYSQDDHTDIDLSPRYQYKWSVNQGVYVNLHWKTQFEQRGTGLSIGNSLAINELDERQTHSGVIGYRYGSDDSIAKLSFELGHQSQQYETRRSQSRILDQKSNTARLTFDYLYGTTTYIATDLSLEQVRFKHQPFYDKDKNTALLGVKWALSSINQFDVLVGYQKVSFQESLFADDSSAKWRINWRWQPLPSASFSFNSSRDFAEANRLVNSYRLVDTHQFTLSKQFNDRFSVEASAGVVQQEVFFEQQQTSEDYLNVDAKLAYQLNSRTRFYLGYRYRDLSASQEYLEHQRENISFGVKVSL